jgi:hypothetical protein
MVMIGASRKTRAIEIRGFSMVADGFERRFLEG